jgi:formiminoglutamase
VPEEVADLCILSDTRIAKDGDEGAREVFALGGEVAAFVTTDIARAIVDLNRDPHDIGLDGVVKTHTCFEETVYRAFPKPEMVKALLDRYYHPYHERLSGAAQPDLLLGVDCHTMLEHAPSIEADPGRERPAICLSNDAGTTCREDWFDALACCLEGTFRLPVSRNDPFTGGYIIRRHGREMPWVQLELSRAPFAPNAEKRRCVLGALRTWSSEIKR